VCHHFEPFCCQSQDENEVDLKQRGDSAKCWGYQQSA